MTSNEPRLSFLEFGSSEEAHSIYGLERAATSHVFPKLQRTAMLCMAGKKGYANQSSLQRREKLGKEQGSTEKKHQDGDTSGRQKLKNLLPFNPADHNTFTDKEQ